MGGKSIHFISLRVKRYKFVPCMIVSLQALGSEGKSGRDGRWGGSIPGQGEEMLWKEEVRPAELNVVGSRAPCLALQPDMRFLVSVSTK